MQLKEYFCKKNKAFNGLKKSFDIIILKKKKRKENSNKNKLRRKPYPNLVLHFFSVVFLELKVDFFSQIFLYTRI